MAIMKVLQFIECAEPGGAEGVLWELAKGLPVARGLSDGGVEVRVLTLDTGWLTEKLESSGIEYDHLESSKKKDLALPFKIASYIKKHKIDIVHSHLLDASFYGALGAKLAGVPHIGTDHGDVHLPRDKKFLRTKIRLMLLAGSYFTAVSSFTKKRLFELGVGEKKVFLLGNPISPSEPILAEERQDIRSSLGLGQHGEDLFIWFHAGMLREVKNQACLIRAFSKVLYKSAVPQVLLIAGEGEDMDALKALAAELDISEQVRFLGLRNDVRRILHAVDGFVLSSLREALPISLLEAGDARVLLVSSDVGGVGDIIIHRQTGYLFESNDDAELADIMVQAVEDRDGSRIVAEAGQKHVRGKYGEEVVLEECVRMYKKVLGK